MGGSGLCVRNPGGHRERRINSGSSMSGFSQRHSMRRRAAKYRPALLLEDERRPPQEQETLASGAKRLVRRAYFKRLKCLCMTSDGNSSTPQKNNDSKLKGLSSIFDSAGRGGNKQSKFFLIAKY